MPVVEQDGSTAKAYGDEAVTRSGKGLVIVCFHGSGAEAGPEWEGLSNRLVSGKHIVVIFDRGAGNPSPAEHIPVMIDYLQRQKLGGPFILVAHSYGGVFAKHFLYRNRQRVAGMILVETGKGGQRDYTETKMLRQTWMGWAPLSVIRGDCFIDQRRALQERIRMARSEQEIEAIDLKKRWLQSCDEEDAKLETEQLKLSWRSHHRCLLNCGHNAIREQPDAVAEEVRWVMENTQVHDPRWWSANHLCETFARLLR